MALSEVTTSFNVHDMFGSDFEPRRAKAWATNNAEGQTIHDDSTGETRIGSGRATIAADGTGTFTHWAPGGDGNPISWQTTYHFDVPDRDAARGRRQESFGPFTVTASGLLTALVEEQDVPPEYLTTVTTLLDGYADAAAASAAAAEAAAADAVDISGISTSDGVVSALIDTVAGPLTQAALSASYVGRYTTIDVVVDHGADLTGATSAVTAFDAAITAANTASGRVDIIVPPGTYDLTAGLSVAIANSHVYIQGSGIGVTTIRHQAGTLFTWGAGTSGGGCFDMTFVALTAPASTARLFDVQGGVSQRFERIQVDNVRQIARLGGVSGASANVQTFMNIRGETDPAAGSIVFDVVKGAGLVVDGITLSAKGVGYPTDATTAHPALTTTLFRFGQGSWDTALVSNVLANRYNIGLDIRPVAAAVVGNMWFTSCVWDYCKTNGIILQGAATSSLRSVYFSGGWAVASDGYSIQVDATNGTMRHIHFTDVVGRQAGKNNWRFTGTNMLGVELVSCHGLGANRLDGTNAGSDKDDLVLWASGVSVHGGWFGEDGSGYVGFTNQGRFGLNVLADIDVRILDVQGDGATNAFSVSTNTVSSRKRQINRNTKAAAGALPEYATTTSPAAPTSNTTQTHLGGTMDTLYIYGGTVTVVTHNGVQVGDGSGPSMLNLRPGDTWAITYSVAPTLRRIVAP